MSNGTWQTIGLVSVESGIFLICDPLSSGVLSARSRKELHAGMQGREYAELEFGTAFRTALGDGNYHVKALVGDVQLDAEGKHFNHDVIKHIRIKIADDSLFK